MAGKKGMRDRISSSPAVAAAVRERIKAGQIQDRLAKHVLGEIEMDASQVTAALGLLKKVVPDLSSVEQTHVEPQPKESDLLGAITKIFQEHPELLTQITSAASVSLPSVPASAEHAQTMQ